MEDILQHESAEQNIVKPSDEAIEFIKGITVKDLAYIEFADTLVTMSDTGETCGEMKIEVERSKLQLYDCFIVNVKSWGVLDGVMFKSAIETYVDFSFRTLKQNHTEKMKIPENTLDRKTFIERDEEGNYSLSQEILQGRMEEKVTKNYKKSDMEFFISEGANFLLERLMVRKPVPDNFILTTLDIDLKLCPVTYLPLESRVQRVEGVDLEVFGVERCIASFEGISTTWHTYLSRDGHMTSRVQVGCPLTMSVTKAPVEVLLDKGVEKIHFEKQPLDWEEDLELVSKFVDRKDELQSDYETYLRHTPEVRNLLADFLQTLLVQKPLDTVQAAADFFSSFSSKHQPPPSYYDSEIPPVFPQSRTSSQIEKLASRTIT